VTPSAAAEAAGDQRAHYGSSSVCVTLLAGAAPAIACLIIYYVNDGANASCAEDLGNWLLVKGAVGCAVQLIQFVLYFFLPAPRDRSVETELADQEEASGMRTRLRRGLTCITCLFPFFMLVWYVAGNVLLWGTEPCDEDEMSSGPASEDCCDSDLWYGVRCC